MSQAVDLRPQDISTDGRWQPVEFEEASIEATYRSLVGTRQDGTPLGLLVPIARKAFARGRPLPAGGVLLGIDVTPGASPPRTVRLEYRASTRERRDRQNRLVLTIAVDLRATDIGHVGTVSFTLRWPTQESHEA